MGNFLKINEHQTRKCRFHGQIHGFIPIHAIQRVGFSKPWSRCSNLGENVPETVIVPCKTPFEAEVGFVGRGVCPTWKVLWNGWMKRNGGSPKHRWMLENPISKISKMDAWGTSVDGNPPHS